MLTDFLYSKVFKSAIKRRETLKHTYGSYVPLLIFEENNIILSPVGLEVIQRILGKVGIIVIGGPIRTGRNSLLNLLINKRELNENIHMRERNPGLWIFDRPTYSDELAILAVSIEGFGTSELDMKLMVVAYIISSVFIYNSRGLIDEACMKKFRVLNVFHKMIDVPGRDPLSVLNQLAPKFIWTLRDFRLNLSKENLSSVTDRDYLESVLNTAQVQSEDFLVQFRETTKAIIEIFQDRDCICFPKPSDEANEDVNMAGLLSPKFTEKLDILKEIAVRQCPPKKFFGQFANGPLVCSMLKYIVQDLNSMSRINFDRTWLLIKETEYQQLLEEAKMSYIGLRNVNIEGMPYDQNTIFMKLQNARLGAIKLLRKSFVQDEILENKLMEDLETFFEMDSGYYLEANLTASIEYNKAVLARIFQPIFQRMAEGYYTKDFNQFGLDWKIKADEYETLAIGPGSFEAFNDFGQQFQNEKFSSFFESIMSNRIQKLANVKETLKTMVTENKQVEKQLNTCLTEEKTWNQLFTEIETKLQIKLDDEEVDEKMEQLVDWVKKKLEDKRRLEEEYKHAEQYRQANRSLTPNRHQTKSCCLIF